MTARLILLLAALICWAAPAAGQTIKSLGYSASNNQVVFAPTNTNSRLTFLKNIQIKGSDTTNIPTLFWQTSDGVGDGAMLAFSRRHATNLWFGINQTNWSQGVWGQNIQPTADGNNFMQKNTNIGAVAVVLENEYNSEQNTNNPPRPVAEMYFRVNSADGTQFRPLMFVGSQTNPVLGYGGSYYPFTVQTTNLGWNATHALTVDFANPSAGATMQIRNMATNSGTYAQLEFINSASTMAFFAKQNKFEMYANHSPGFHVLQSVTNGVIIGGSFASSAAARVQLGGDTRIDGTITFDNTTNAATTRTNLGLGWPALTNAQSTLYSGQATRLLGYAPEVVAGTTNLTGFNVVAYTNTNGLVIPANILIGEDQAPAPRNTRNVTVNGSVTIQTPFSSPTTIYANNSITATDDSSYTNTLVTWGSNTVTMGAPIAFSTNTATDATRTNLGLGLPALTNTSNVTTMRALAGATNTNEPFSGSISVVGTNNTNTLVFSNGILLSQ